MDKLAVAKSRVAGDTTVICCTRYGNVMASRGSVVSPFIRQIQPGEPLTREESAEAEDMGERGRAYYRQHLSHEAGTARFEAAFRRVVADRN